MFVRPLIQTSTDVHSFASIDALNPPFLADYINAFYLLNQVLEFLIRNILIRLLQHLNEGLVVFLRLEAFIGFPQFIIHFQFTF